MGDIILPEIGLLRRKVHIGEFNGKSVDITDPVSIQMLYNMGYFGKGYLSRSKPKNCGEFLSLGLEEAFFLSFALEALVVKYKGNILTLEEMCEKFIAGARDFLAKYVVYHHFKCKGWVVKPGLKFSSDFVLYWESPETFHGSYLVLIVDQLQKLSWTDFCGFDRVAENASKELIMCSVELPSSYLGPNGFAGFLAEAKLEINVLSRWVGAQNRDVSQ